jgi:phosphatidylglycerophosphate synthase
MTAEKFGGAGAKHQSLLAKFEKKIVDAFVDKIPKGLETYHLTMMTVIWSLLIVLFGYLATFNIYWLSGAAVCVAFQYVTDLFDGAVGRRRNTGLIKWGFYMDHFLDFIFLCSVLISFWFISPKEYDLYLFFLLALFGAFMVESYLRFGATNNFKIAHLGFGPTEIRIGFIVVYALNIFLDRTFLSSLIPYLFAAAFIGLCYVVYATQKEIWEMDMKAKAEERNDADTNNA